MHFAIVDAHRGAARSNVIPVDVSSMARIVARTNNAIRTADDSRPVTVPWTHGLRSLDKQTASFLNRLADQAVSFAASNCIALQGEQLRQLLHVVALQ